MQTIHGPVCDVCGKYILPLDPDERVVPFSIAGIDEELMAHQTTCVTPLCKAMRKADWTLLPEGPLRQAFQV